MEQVNYELDNVEVLEDAEWPHELNQGIVADLEIDFDRGRIYPFYGEDERTELIQTVYSLLESLIDLEKDDITEKGRSFVSFSCDEGHTGCAGASSLEKSDDSIILKGGSSDEGWSIGYSEWEEMVLSLAKETSELMREEDANYRGLDSLSEPDISPEDLDSLRERVENMD